jgi:predicted short-subunit dehydrogenase-like oxidoreductase (DUF2520 family)
MKIGFIGAGKVATAFGRHLYAHDITISGYFDRHPEKMAHASRSTASTPFQNAAQVAQNSDVILITTRDDQIKAVCDDLCRANAIGTSHLVGHMSGAHSSLLLSEAGRKGAALFSLHPLQAFAQEEKALTDLPGTYFSLEGADPRLATVETLMEKTGNRCFRLAPEHKSLYHLAACVLSNYIVTLMDFGLAVLEKGGIAPQEGFQAMLPLIQGTIANIARMGPARALTGPIARGDATTIRQHMDALNIDGAQQWREMYAWLGLKTLRLAKKTLLSEKDKAETLAKILNDDE